MIIKLPWFDAAGNFGGYWMKDCISPAEEEAFIGLVRADLRRHSPEATKRIAIHFDRRRKARDEAARRELEREARMRAEEEAKREAAKHETADGQLKLF